MHQFPWQKLLGCTESSPRVQLSSWGWGLDQAVPYARRRLASYASLQTGIYLRDAEGGDEGVRCECETRLEG